MSTSSSACVHAGLEPNIAHTQLLRLPRFRHRSARVLVGCIQCNQRKYNPLLQPSHIILTADERDPKDFACLRRYIKTQSKISKVKGIAACSVDAASDLKREPPLSTLAFIASFAAEAAACDLVHVRCRPTALAAMKSGTRRARCTPASDLYNDAGELTC